MRNGIILPAMLSLWNDIHEKWKTSFFASIISRFSGFISRSLMNSVIISSVLDYKTRIYSESLVKKLIKSLIKLMKKAFCFVNRLFSKSEIGRASCRERV